MKDRKARDQMAKVLRSYMDEEITAFQFDDALNDAMNGTEDKTAQTIGHALWFHYDDCKDHKIVASKEEWDYFNRTAPAVDKTPDCGLGRDGESASWMLKTDNRRRSRRFPERRMIRNRPTGMCVIMTSSDTK